MTHSSPEIATLRRVFDKISTRLNNTLCEMKPDYDDSIVGFNEAWDIMRAIFNGELAKEIPPVDGAVAQAAGEPVDITGWKLVPDDPTEQMWQAGRTADINPGDSYSKVWRAMFDAAPDVDDCETIRTLPQPAPDISTATPNATTIAAMEECEVAPAVSHADLAEVLANVRTGIEAWKGSSRRPVPSSLHLACQALTHLVEDAPAITSLRAQLAEAEAEDERLRQVCHGLGDKLASARKALEACHEYFEKRSSIRWSDPLRAQVRDALARQPAAPQEAPAVDIDAAYEKHAKHIFGMNPRPIDSITHFYAGFKAAVALSRPVHTPQASE